MKRLEINVTARDIKYGTRGSWCACPVIRALHRHRECKGWWGHGLLLVSADCQTAISTPGRARLFMEAFDEGRPVEPFRFTLEMPT